MPTLLMLKGLPASGKTTFAKALVNNDPAYAKVWGKRWKRVNKDDLRTMLDNSEWSKGNENFVLDLRDQIIVDAFLKGINVVVDDTNLAPKHEEHLRIIADNAEARFDVKFFDVPPEECIRRDLLRPVSVGSKVIYQMYNQYLKEPPKPYMQDFSKPAAIICDIDGTLAHNTGDRSPYDWHRVGEDTPDFAVRNILAHYWGYRNFNEEELPTTIILFSGRDEVCRPETEQWLAENNVKYDYLYMRPKDDKRKDYMVKEEMFNAHIAGRYNVLFVLDDRNQVVKLWREMGLKCLQVEDGEF